MAMAAGDAKALTYPASACTLTGYTVTAGNPASIDCVLFSTDNTGAYAGTTPTFTWQQLGLPANYNAVISPLTAGYLVILKPGTATGCDVYALGQFCNTDSNQADWQQVLVIPPTPGTAATGLQLMTVGCATEGGTSTSCFPSFATVTGTPYNIFVQGGTNLTSIDVSETGDYLFNVAVGAPEPGTVGTLFLGLAGIVTVLRKRSAIRK